MYSGFIIVAAVWSVAQQGRVKFLLLCLMRWWCQRRINTFAANFIRCLFTRLVAQLGRKSSCCSAFAGGTSCQLDLSEQGSSG
jgi:hypothetical protein